MGVQPTEPGWYHDPDGVHSHQAYWDGEKWTGRIRMSRWLIGGANRLAIASIVVGGLGAMLVVPGWAIRGDLFEGQAVTGWMIVSGVALGTLGLFCWFLSLAIGRARKSEPTGLARSYGLFACLVAVSPALYLFMLIGAAFNSGNN